MKKYFDEVVFDSGHTALLSKDGGIYSVPNNPEWCNILKLSELLRGNQGWYFNSSKDRYAVEIFCGDSLSVNPSYMYQCLGSCKRTISLISIMTPNNVHNTHGIQFIGATESIKERFITLAPQLLNQFTSKWFQQGNSGKWVYFEIFEDIAENSVLNIAKSFAAAFSISENDIDIDWQFTDRELLLRVERI